MIFTSGQLIISEDKILNYLLVKKAKNDKSGFLEKLGFTRQNYQDLIAEIKRIATSHEAILAKKSEFGSLYKVEGNLKKMMIVTIWIEQIDKNKFRFVTLYPVM